MKFHEKLLELRRRCGLSQEELGMELAVSRQTISKWETGQSYPDFERLVLLSDFFSLSLDELVRDVDVQDVREKAGRSEEKISALFADAQKGKEIARLVLRGIVVFGWVMLAVMLLALVLVLVRGV